MMGIGEVAGAAADSLIVVVVDNADNNDNNNDNSNDNDSDHHHSDTDFNDTTNNNVNMLVPHDPLRAVHQAPAGDSIHAGEVHDAATAAAAAAASSGKEEDSEDSESKSIMAHLLPCRICLGVDLEGCEPASLMPLAAIQSLQEEGLDLRHFMACGPHCTKPAGDCTSSPTTLRCGCRGGMAVAHYVCMIGWLAKRKTHKCEICGQIVASIRAADIVLFAGEANHLVDVNNNFNAAAAVVDNLAQPHPFIAQSRLKAWRELAWFYVPIIVWQGGVFTLAEWFLTCWSLLHEPKKAIIVAASLLSLHIISIPCIILISAKAKCLPRTKDRMVNAWNVMPVCLVVLLMMLSGTSKYC